LTYKNTGAASYTVTEGSTVATINLASGLSDTAALASINTQLKAAGINDVTAVADGTGTTGAYSLQSASTFSSTLTSAVGTGTVGAVVPAVAGGNGALNAINAVN